MSKKTTVLCVSGKMQSGKNQFADYLSEEIEALELGKQKHDMFAGELKKGAYKDFKRLSNQLISEYERLRDKYDEIAPELKDDIAWMDVNESQFYEDKTLLTRALLQIYGTDIFCNRIDEDYWAKQVMQHIEAATEQFIIITDTRFPNELQLLQNNHNFRTIGIRIERDTGIECDHPSETSFDNFLEWDFIVDNNGSLKDLKESATAVIETLILDYKLK
jgi:hypothetical protein